MASREFERRLRGLRCSVLFGLALAAATPQARAQAPQLPQATVPAQAPPSAEPKRYAAQTLIVDAVGVVAGAVVAQTRGGDAQHRLGLIAATWYGIGAVAAPAVHHAHGNWPVGLADFGLRAIVPPTAGVFGLLTACIANRDFERSCARDGWAVGSLIGLAGTAAADALVFADERLRPISQPNSHWYGGHILLLDAVGYGLGVFYATRHPKTKSGKDIHPATATWALGYTVGFIGAPILHFAHGRVGYGFLSLGARLLISPMGALPGVMGYCAATAGAKDCAAHGAQWGLLGGSLAVSLFDAFVLAREPVDADPSYATTASLGAGSLAIRGYF